MPTNLFITNTANANLGQRLRELISTSREMRALVGFFYFSGVKVLYEALRANPDIKLRILVGMEAEEHCGQLQELVLAASGLNRGQAQEAYLENLRRALRSASLDKQAFYERVQGFVELVREGRLVLRKTREPNHAKLYLFDIAEPFHKVKPGVWISGSSNLTQPGLETNGELNLDLSDFGFAEAGAYFDELWHDAVPLTENEAVRQKILSLIDRASIVAPVTPFEAYLLVLKNYVEHRMLADHGVRMARILADAGYTRYTYQVDAVNQAMGTLEAYNGVIVADVVGLGKTVIACLIARLRGRRGIVIAPPGLVGDRGATTGWEAYLRQFKLHDWEVRSCGSLEEVRAYVERDGTFRTVIVDEAHRFRNQNTEDYDDLLQICRSKEVILLTATPFNNRPADLLSLLKLFLPPKNCPLVLDGNMEADFKEYGETFRMIGFVLKNMKSFEKYDEVCRMLERLRIALLPEEKNFKKIKKELGLRAAELARRMRAVIEPVTIRRNRLDLRGNPDYAKEITTLSTVRPPAEQFFCLSKKQSEFYDRVITEYFGPDGRFHGAIYRPGQYDTSDDREESQQINMFTFIRGLFVRRFESSFGAFARSLDHAITMHEKVQEFAKETGTLLVNRTLMDKILTAADGEREDLLEEIIKELKRGESVGHQQVYHLDQNFDADHFFRDVKADIKLLKAVREEMRELNLEMHDPKAQQLIAILQAVLTGTCKEIAGKHQRKVLIFSEYADTVDHLQGYLDIALPGKVLVVNDKLSREMDRKVKTNFDASWEEEEQVDDYQILLATDRMSEGFNLNRAGLVINYDIPWNPTRVIQRVGRINRIGKKVFENLYIFNFFPTEQGADIHRSRQIAGEKMFLIHSTIGEDVQILAPDEEPTAAKLFQRVNSDAEEQEGESFLTKAQRELTRLSKNHPETLERIAQLPPRVKTASRHTPKGVYFFRRRGAALFTLLHSAEAVTTVTIEEGLEAIRCEPEEPRVEFTPEFWLKYGSLCAYARPPEQETPSTQGWVARARNQLASLLETVPEIRRQFLELLIEDIQYYGTLSERTLRKIAKPDISTTEGMTELLNTLDSLKGELGTDYLDSYRKTGTEDQIIITIEQQGNPVPVTAIGECEAQQSLPGMFVNSTGWQMPSDDLYAFVLDIDTRNEHVYVNLDAVPVAYVRRIPLEATSDDPENNARYGMLSEMRTYAIRMTLTPAQYALTFQQERPIIAEHWYRVKLAPSGEFTAEVFNGDADSERGTTQATISPIQHNESNLLHMALALPPPSPVSEIEALLNSIKRDCPTSISVYNVGQGLCSAICDARNNMPIVYFDFGCGCHGDADTRPKKMSFCFENNPPIILSHWHADHYMAAYMLDKRALACKWIAPEQEGTPDSAKFAARLKLIKHLLIWPNTLPSLKTQWGDLVKCTGNKLNTSGLAWDAVIGEPASSQGPRYRVLMPGDAGYDNIGTATISDCNALIVAHHGGAASGRIPAPAPKTKQPTFVIPYGKSPKTGTNSHGHPVGDVVKALQTAGWTNQLSTPDGNIGIGYNPKSICLAGGSCHSHCKMQIQQTWP